MVRPEGDNALIRYKAKSASDVDPYPLVVAGDYLTVAASVGQPNEAFVGAGFPVLVDRNGTPEEMLVNFDDVVCVEIDANGAGVLVIEPYRGRRVRYAMEEAVTEFQKTFADDSADLLYREGVIYDTRLAGELLTDDSTTETGATEAAAIPLSVTIPTELAAAAVLIPWTRNPYAVVTAYADDGTGGGSYAALAESYDFSTTKTTLWVKVTAVDETTEKFYVITVSLPEEEEEE